MTERTADEFVLTLLAAIELHFSLSIRVVVALASTVDERMRVFFHNEWAAFVSTIDVDRCKR